MYIQPRFVSIVMAALLSVSLWGCTGRASIPGSAHMVKGGQGKLAYTAEQNGNIYLLDADQNKKVFEGHVRRGDQVVVIPAQDRIVVAGEDADHKPALLPEHRYQIFFDPGE